MGLRLIFRPLGRLGRLIDLRPRISRPHAGIALGSPLRVARTRRVGIVRNVQAPRMPAVQRARFKCYVQPLRSVEALDENRILRPATPNHLSTPMNPTYSSYYLFGRSHGEPIWAWKTWQQAVPLLDPVVTLCSELPSIRVLLEERSRERVRFGRMNWNLKHNEKWALRCADTQCNFFDTEIAFPSRGKCDKTPGLEPEVLIFVANANLLRNADRNVDQAIVIHIRHELLNVESQAKVTNSVEAISRLLDTRIAGHMRRPSAFRSQYGGYTDAIWQGTHGVLNADDTDFSDDFKSYGITRLGT